MTANLTRPSVWLLSVTAALTLTAATALPAAAATAPAKPAAPRVSLAEATTALPLPASIPPGNVTGFHKSSVAKPTGLSPCGLADKSLRLDLHDYGAAIGAYSTAASVPLSKFSQWIVATRVYPSTVAAHRSVARLGVVDLKCPKVATTTSGGTKLRISRTWNGRYVTGGWHGYHTVDVIKVAGEATQLRHIAVYLQRGNAMIQVDEIAAVVGHNAGVQENRRLAVQLALAARVTAAARD